MPQIIALNPRKTKRPKPPKKKAKKTTKKPIKKLAAKPAKTITKKGSTMAKGSNKKGKKRAKKRSNPSKTKYVTRYAQQTIGGIRMGSAVKSMVPMLLGAVTAKFAAKKFAEGGAETENWNWKNYAFALLGGTVAAIGTSALLKKKAAAQKVFEGALLLVAYKFLTNEVAPRNSSLEAWFGDDDIDPYAGTGYGADYEEYGDIWQGDDADYVQGLDGGWRPVDESHRLPQGVYGDVMVTPDSRYGDVMVTPDSRYGDAAINTASAFEVDGM